MFSVSVNFFANHTCKNWEVTFTDFDNAKASFNNAVKTAPTMFEGMPYSVLLWELREDYSDMLAEFGSGMTEPEWYN